MITYSANISNYPTPLYLITKVFVSEIDGTCIQLGNKRVPNSEEYISGRRDIRDLMNDFDFDRLPN